MIQKAAMVRESIAATIFSGPGGRWQLGLKYPAVAFATAGTPKAPGSPRGLGLYWARASFSMLRRTVWRMPPFL
jgi:hypothetical protein